jgi:YD repeat-containing protein
MRAFLFMLLGALALPAVALQCADPSDPGNSNTQIAPPVTGLWTITVYDTAGGNGQYRSIDAACGHWIASNPGYASYGLAAGGAYGLGQCNAYASNGSLANGADMQISGALNDCPSGYTKSGSTCTSLTSQVVNDAVTTMSGSITRNSDGNITAMSMPKDGGGTATWSNLTYDGSGRLTSATLPDSTTPTYMYYPNTQQVFSRTDSGGTTFYIWNNASQLAMMIMPNGDIIQPLYQTSADGAVPVMAQTGYAPGPQIYTMLGLSQSAGPNTLPVLDSLGVSIVNSPDNSKVWSPGDNPALPDGGNVCDDPVGLLAELKSSSTNAYCQWVRQFVCFGGSVSKGPVYIGFMRAETAISVKYISCMMSHGCKP